MCKLQAYYEKFSMYYIVYWLVFSYYLPSVHGERMGSSLDAAQAVGEGNASLSLTKLKVMDEGTYICTVSIGPFHAQQVVQLRITRKFHPVLIRRFLSMSFSIMMILHMCLLFPEPPIVSLSQEKLVSKKSPQTLSCHCSKYYPLDAQVTMTVLM